MHYRQGSSSAYLQVARRTFVRALQERGSVVLVPGGQAELVHTWRRTHHGEFVIYCRHKGAAHVLDAGHAGGVSS